MRLAANSFDVCLNTLYSNLPSRSARDLCNSLVHKSLKPTGRYVLSAHSYNLISRIKQLPMSGHYSVNGVFYQTFTPKMLAGELQGFLSPSVQPFVSELPFVKRLKWERFKHLASRIADSLPVLRECGILLIADARKAERR